jgi:hypothetical protein
MDRIIGVLTLKAPVYRAIAEDQNATTTAAIIVVVVALAAAIIGAAAFGITSTSLPPEFQQYVPQRSAIGYAISVVLSTLIGWVVGSWIFAFVSKTFFGGKTNTGEMLRVFGYTQIFAILYIIPCCGALLGLILSVIGAIIGIREASEFSTGKAIGTGIVGFIGVLVVQAVVGLVLGALPI